MIKKLLIANRGEIALRITRACKSLGIKTVGVYSQADSNLMHLRFVDESVCIGKSAVNLTYLNSAAIITAAQLTGCDAVHPGYGFLSENADFAEQVEDAGLIFVGPRAEHIRLMGNKVSAINAMKAAGVPTVPGSSKSITINNAREEAQKIGFPLLIKAASGGGGRGMRVVERLEDLNDQVHAARSEAESFFGDDTVYVERYLKKPRHVEVQILGDGNGNAIHLFDRDCSLQRRHQKVLEEAPAVDIDQTARQQILEACVKATENMRYRGLGTFEFLYENASFFFIEMNTRIQVEHPVTECITGIDLLVEQIRIASGLTLRHTQEQITTTGHAIEFRINAEDPVTFRPSPGTITAFHAPCGHGIRFDSHVYAGYTMPNFYDSMIGKLIVHAESRAACLQKSVQALDELVIEGISTNISLHKNAILKDQEFLKTAQSIHYLEKKILVKPVEQTTQVALV